MQVVVQNLLTNYQIQGAGKPLVLLHGWGADLNSFKLILPELAKAYTVYVLDLPGFGKTQKPNGAWKVDDYVVFVDAFLAKFEIQKAVFLGHSFGGRILIKLAVKKPILFEKLILTGAAGMKPSKTLKKCFFGAFAKVGKGLLSLPLLNKLKENAQKKLYQMAGVEDYLHAGELKQTFVNVIQEDLTPFLSKIKVPTLLIWGGRDQDTPLQDGQKMQNLIPQAKLEVIETAGHYAFIDEPQCFLDLLQNDF